MNTSGMLHHTVFTQFGAALIISVIALPVPADDHWLHRAQHHDHDHARYALEHGQIRPLADILAQVAAAVPGEVVSVEFERHHHGRGNWRYEIKVLAPDGRLRAVEVDAASGRLLTDEDD